MKIKINKEQILNIAEKMLLCVDFLKKEVQPHLIKNDKIVVPVGNEGELELRGDLELHITRKKLYILHIIYYSIGPESWGFAIPQTKPYTLEKNKKCNNKKDSQYICEGFPEAAIEFFKHWDSIKEYLLQEVATKNQEVAKINNVIDNFRL